MKINTAYRIMSIKQFVNWALENNYPYFIGIEGNREHGIIWPKRGNTKYRFDYKIKE